MKENQIEKESEELISEEIFENDDKNTKISKEINLSIFNYEENKLEKYKLLNEENELLLCKEDSFEELLFAELSSASVSERSFWASA